MRNWTEELIEEVRPYPLSRVLIDWGRTTDFFAVGLPEDYMSFVSQFGGGTIAGELWIYAPDCPDVNFDIVEQTKVTRRLIEETWDVAIPKPDFLRQGSSQLICWGGTGSAEVLFWSCETSDPASWPVVVWNPEDSTCEVFDDSFSRFVVKSLRGEIPQERFFSTYHYAKNSPFEPWPHY